MLTHLTKTLTFQNFQLSFTSLKHVAMHGPFLKHEATSLKPTVMLLIYSSEVFFYSPFSITAF